MIKCHTCNKELQKDKDSRQGYFECPELHVLNVAFDGDGNVYNYMLFWDDVPADFRYRLEANQNHTNLRSRPLLQRIIPDHKPGDCSDSIISRWSTLMTMGHHFPLILKDETIQVENLVHRLLKLKAFA